MSVEREKISEVIADMRTYDYLDSYEIDDFVQRLREALERARSAYRMQISRMRKTLAGATTSATETATKTATETATESVTEKEKEGKERPSPQTPYREKGPEKESALTLTGECGARAHVRGDVPGLNVVLSACEPMGVPDFFAKWWYAEMQARDWMTTGGKHIDNRTWRPTLRTWFLKADSEELERAREYVAERGKAQKLLSFTAKDWVLCKERCANFKGKSCGAGIAIPPEKFAAFPHPPDECPKFKALAAGKGVAA